MIATAPAETIGRGVASDRVGRDQLHRRPAAIAAVVMGTFEWLRRRRDAFERRAEIFALKRAFTVRS